MQRLERVAAVVAIGALSLWATAVFRVWQGSRRDTSQVADAIVVLGAQQHGGRPLPVLAARLDHAAELYHRGMAPVVVVTGGRGPGEALSEASVSARYLLSKGVPQNGMLREEVGRSTWESLTAIAGLPQLRTARTLLLVSDPFHSYRTTVIARGLGFEAFASPTRSSPITGVREAKFLWRETVAVTLGWALGFRRLNQWVRRLPEGYTRPTVDIGAQDRT